MDWGKLHRRFFALAEKTEITKISSYCLDIGFSNDGGVTVHLGTYDIADWPRHTNLGWFATEAEAYEATEKKISEAEEAVKLDCI